MSILHKAAVRASIASWRPDGKNRTVDYRLIAAAFFLAAFLCGCGGSGKGLPADRADYVAEWQSRVMYLLITEGGIVDYKRITGRGYVYISEAPIRGFKGDDFSVGVPLFSSTFVVSKRPYREGGRWKMVVDGVELIRTAGPMLAEPSPVHQPSAAQTAAAVQTPASSAPSRRQETAALRAPSAAPREVERKCPERAQKDACVIKPVMSDEDLAKCR